MSFGYSSSAAAAASKLCAHVPPPGICQFDATEGFTIGFDVPLYNDESKAKSSFTFDLCPGSSGSFNPTIDFDPVQVAFTSDLSVSHKPEPYELFKKRSMSIGGVNYPLGVGRLAAEVSLNPEVDVVGLDLEVGIDLCYTFDGQLLDAMDTVSSFTFSAANKKLWNEIYGKKFCSQNMVAQLIKFYDTFSSVDSTSVQRATNKLKPFIQDLRGFTSPIIVFSHRLDTSAFCTAASVEQFTVSATERGFTGGDVDGEGDIDSPTVPSSGDIAQPLAFGLNPLAAATFCTDFSKGGCVGGPFGFAIQSTENFFYNSTAKTEIAVEICPPPGLTPRITFTGTSVEFNGVEHRPRRPVGYELFIDRGHHVRHIEGFPYPKVPEEEGLEIPGFPLFLPAVLAPTAGYFEFQYETLTRVDATGFEVEVSGNLCFSFTGSAVSTMGLLYDTENTGFNHSEVPQSVYAVVDDIFKTRYCGEDLMQRIKNIFDEFSSLDLDEAFPERPLDDAMGGSLQTLSSSLVRSAIEALLEALKPINDIRKATIAAKAPLPGTILREKFDVNTLCTPTSALTYWTTAAALGIAEPLSLSAGGRPPITLITLMGSLATSILMMQ